MSPPLKPADPKLRRAKGSFFRTMKAVLWSFVGLRSRGEFEEDVTQLNPLHIVLAGFIVLIMFIGGLALLARWVVG